MKFVTDKLEIACLSGTMWPYFPRFSNFLLFLSPKGSCKKSEQYEKIENYLSSCARNRAKTNAC